MSKWVRYYDAAGDEPRHTLLDAVARFAQPGTAVDLGCGLGRDTVELLRRGWQVVAIDATPEAIERLRARTGDDERLETHVSRMEDAAWERCDLVNASYALPFCPRARFGELWGRVTGSLGGGGRFAGQLFGDRDGWAPADDITFHTRGEAEALLQGFELERFDEVELDGTTAAGDPKHWHLFHVVARRR